MSDLEKIVRKNTATILATDKDNIKDSIFMTTQQMLNDLYVTHEINYTIYDEYSCILQSAYLTY